MNPRRAAAAAALLLALAWPVAALAARLAGVVTDPAGKPVEFANVTVRSLKKGAVTDDRGRFALELPAGPVTLEVSQVGYRTARLAVELADGAAPLSIVLAEEPVALAEVNVSASSFGKAGEVEGAVLHTLDVYTTPGAAADLFQAIRALPGVNPPAEGAALYVRGGDPDETLVRVDGGELGHPYHSEGASGGLFSALDTYMIESAYFSSGGFSARYGGVLSGVLDIRTRDPMDLRTVSLTAHMAGGSVSGAWALVPGRLSLIGSVSRSNPALLFRVYGSSHDFESTPLGGNGFGRLLYRYSPSGRLSLGLFHSTDDVGVKAEILNSVNLIRSTATNRVASLDLNDVLRGRMAVRAQLSWQDYDSEWAMGPFASLQSEHNVQGNAEAVWPLGDRHELSFGANLRRRDTTIEGRAPADSTDFLPGAPTRPITTQPRIDYPGFFVEDKLRLLGPLYATLGARFDHADPPNTWSADPRAALALRIGDHQTLRLSAGRFHQPAKAEYLDPVYGNPALGVLSADHVIAGYEWLSDYGTVRLEAYRKDYRDLVTQDSVTFYANDGFGYARGVDALVQGTFGWLSGWVSYGWLDSRRKELDHPTEVPSEYGVRHALTVVGKYRITSEWELGAKYGWTTGRPFTPVVGSTYDAARGIWHPIYGDHHSEEIPEFHRLDVRLTRLFSLPALGGLPASGVCIAFVEVLNALDTRNVLDYVYNDDYSERRAIDSYFSRRMAVAGFSLSW